MKRKLLALLMGASAFACCAFGLTACGSNGSGTTGSGSHTHTWKQSWSKNGTHHWHDCEGEDCAEKDGYAEHDFTDGDCECGEKASHTHTWEQSWSKDDTHHWHACESEDCTEKDGYAEHDFTNGDCECGEKAPHTHTWEQSWSKDDTHHWHACEGEDCTEKDGYAEHDFTDGDCECGEKPPHTHIWEQSWSKDDTHHWHACENEDCEEKDGYAEHDFTDGDCECGKGAPATEGLAYELNTEGTAYICTGIGTAEKSEIVIAREYNNLPVTAIAYRAFDSSKEYNGEGEPIYNHVRNVVKVTIPDTIEIIERQAFYDCNATVIYCEAESKPDGWDTNWKQGSSGRAVNGVIWDCNNNDKDENGNCYTRINGITYSLFTNEYDTKCARVQGQPVNLSGKITIPKEVEYEGETYWVRNIVYDAFLNCSEITEVVLSGSLSTVGEAAFRGCTSLESLTLPFVGMKKYNASDSVQYMQNFLLGTIFGSQQYDDSYKAMQAYTYYDNSTLKTKYNNYYIPNSLKHVTVLKSSLMYGAFSACRLESVTLEKDVYINTNAFIRTSRTAAGDQNFINARIENITVDCDSLISYLPKDGLKTIVIKNETAKDFQLTYRDKLGGCTTLTEITLPAGIVLIGDSALAECTALTDIYFNGTVEEWTALEKGTEWDRNTGDYTVHCSDGDAAKAVEE